MRISTIVNKEEKRVAITPGVIGKYLSMGIEVVIPSDIGRDAGYSDEEYVAAGASIWKEKSIPDAEIYACIHPPLLCNFRSGSYLIALLTSFRNRKIVERLRSRGVHLCALEKIPRISRAQSMDVLSSQANVAGYRAALEALVEYQRVVPLMMTAAGTIRPARVLVLGAGVAGLQAIATAKRLGASVSALDVRVTAKEQVESLGARFIDVGISTNGETAGGYAKEMDIDYQERQADKLRQVVPQVDIVITTAQIPGKPAPKLISEDMVRSMSSGSVIVDMATESGGNCVLSEKGKVIRVGDVTIVGRTDFAARVAHDSSQLFARNVFNFVSLMLKNGEIDISDEIIQATIAP
ncbi:MAG: NAD(P) transhydrogenase subunit alpha [Holosporaceae bacterium]|nr:NAD(P) transhydrogenase subunit alpha [Holosporaceae bacterium]